VEEEAVDAAKDTQEEAAAAAAEAGVEEAEEEQDEEWMVNQAADVEWMYFRTDNGTEIVVDYAASQYGLFDYLQALPRPSGMRRYVEWGAQGLVDHVEYASFYMHARLSDLSADEQARRDEEEEAYMHDMEKRLIFLRDAVSGQEVPLTQGEYTPPTSASLYGAMHETISSAQLDALVQRAQRRETSGETRARLEKRLSRHLQQEKSRQLLAQAFCRAQTEDRETDRQTDTNTHTHGEGVSQEQDAGVISAGGDGGGGGAGEGGGGGGILEEEELGQLCTDMLYLAFRDLLGGAVVALADDRYDLRQNTLMAGDEDNTLDRDHLPLTNTSTTPEVEGKGGGLDDGGVKEDRDCESARDRDMGGGGEEEEEREQEDVSEEDEVVMMQWAASIGDVRSLRTLHENNAVRLSLLATNNRFEVPDAFCYYFYTERERERERERLYIYIYT
jgi:hypothetical protein